MARALENIEFACGLAELLKGDYSEQASTGATALGGSSSSTPQRSVTPSYDDDELDVPDFLK